MYDQFPLGNNFYIVMELVDGLNVEQYVQQYGAMPWERATRFMVQILEAMQFVHEKNFVHRDMKPSNIMIRNDERICILDFGIAKDMGSQGSGTVIGTIIGSDGYMSPEQADGASIDHRADIYALGCVFYYMLTGHHAYNTLASDFETRSNIANTPFPKLSKHSKKSFPAKLQEILDHATDKNMMKRYQSCREFRKDLENLLPSASRSHTVISSNKTESIFITVGREGCDIIVDDPMMKVSRSHLDITYKQFTGGRYYVITDHSSNGTLVNGRKISRNESENIPADGPAPQVFLAADMNYPLEWEKVKELIAGKLGQAAGDPTGETHYDGSFHSDAAGQGLMNMYDDGPANASFTDAVKLFFTRYFDFRGRSRRKEYWYPVLFNTLVYMALNILSIIFIVLAARSNSGNVFAAISLILSIVVLIYAIAIIIPSIAVQVRRLHDIGKSGWYILVSVIPIIGGIMMFIWMVTDSEPSENEWGPCPK